MIVKLSTVWWYSVLLGLISFFYIAFGEYTTVTSFSQLSSALSNDDSTIYISQSFSFPHEIVLHNKVNISMIGVGSITLTASGHSRLFNITGSNNISFISLSMLGSKSTEVDFGGLLYVADSSAYLRDIHVQDGVANCGGGMYAINTKLSIDSSSFKDNAALECVENALFCGGGLSVKLSIVEILDTVFDNNHGPSAGLMCVQSSITLSNTNFSSNIAALDGGASSFIDSKVEMSTVSAITNTATNTGGAFKFQSCNNVSIVGLSCYENVANSTGGCLSSAHSNIHMKNSAISDSVAIIGAGIFLDEGIYYMEDSTFINNNALFSAGAIFSKGATEVYLLNSFFTRNRAASEGGAITLENGPSLNVENVTFTDNGIRSATFHPVSLGGAIFCSAAETRFLKVGFNGSYSERGSVIYSASCTVEMKLSSVTASLSLEAAIYAAEDSSVYLESVDFVDNLSKLDAVVLFCISTISCVMERCLFENNVAVERGTILIQIAEFSIANSIFRNNLAEAGGGGIFITSSTGSVVNCTFEGNTALEFGGAMYLEQDSVVSIDDCLFANNTGYSGGAVYLWVRSQVIVRNSTFYHNIGIENGGAISVVDHSSVNGTILIFNECTAVRGGAIYSSGYSTVHLSHIHSYNDSASYTGGFAALEIHAELVIEMATIEGCFAVIGGVFSTQYESSVSISESVIQNNTASQYGAVVFSLVNNDIYFIDCQVQFNFAEYGGGVVFAEASNVHFSSSNVQNNGAARGAVAYLEIATATITNSTFIKNGGRACVMGGVIYGITSSKWLSDASTYRSNQAFYGGAVSLYSSFVLSISDEWFNNKAVLGGCFYGVYQSNLMLVSSIFSNNVGVNPSSDATILYLDVGVFSLIDCFVSSNSAKDFGAVMLLSGGAQINGTIFRGNSAKGPGGILYFSAGSLGSQIGVSSNTEVTITNSTFIKNHAYNGNGGAVAIDNYPGDINIANCTFSQNTAISGGAISSTGTNVFIDYCTFTENSAIQGGGGLYWTYASRYLVQMNHTIASVGNTAAYGPLKATNYIEIVSKVEDPSILDVSGSVIASSIIISFLDYYEQVVTNSSSLDSYQQTVSASIFDGDTGILKGQTVVIGASGTAVFSSLIVTALPGKNITLAFTVPDPSVEDTYTTLYFRNCIPGEIETSTEQGTAACSVCTVGTYSFDPTASTCEICPANAYCPGGDVIEVDAGYWRDSYYSATILRCFFRNVCLGGSNTTNQCAEGNTGPYCSVCEDGYAQDTEGGCYACDSSSIVGEVVAPIVFVIVIVILLVAFRYRKKIFKLVKAKIGEFNEGSHYRKFRIKIKILVAFIQILFELGPSLNIVFPDVYTHYLDYFTILDLDGLNLPAISCAVSTNYYTSLVVATISPMVLMLLILIALHLLVIRANRLNRLRPYYTAERAKMDSIQAFFLLSYFLLISVSTTIFQVYQCETFDDGGVYLVADYSIDCEADDRVFYLLYGTVMMFIYPIGIPLAYGIMLFRNRRKINPPYTLVVDKTEIGVVSDSVVQGKKIKVRKTYKELNYMKVLYDNYLPRRWYFELFDCARRLALGAIPVLIIRGSVLQIVIVLLMSLISVAVLMEKKPYIANADNDLAILAQWSITLVLVTALCIRVDVASESKQSSDIMGGILIVINILVIATAIVTTIISTNVTDEEDDQKLFEIEDPLAKLRGSEEEEEEEEKDGEGEEDGSDEDEEMKPSTGSDSIYDRDSSFVEEKKVKYKQSKGFKGYYDREDDETPSLSFVEPTEIEMSSMSKLRNNSIQSQSVSNVDTFHDSAHNPITNIMQSSNSKDETKFESEPDSVGKRNPKPNNSTKNPIFVRKDANDVIDSDDED